MNQKTFLIAIEFEEQDGCDTCNIECLPDYLFGLLHADDERERKSPGYGERPTYTFRDLTVYNTVGDLLKRLDDGSAQPRLERGEYEAARVTQLRQALHPFACLLEDPQTWIDAGHGKEDFGHVFPAHVTAEDVLRARQVLDGTAEAKGECIAYAVEGVAHVHFLGASMIRCGVYADKGSALARAQKEAEEVCQKHDDTEHEELPDGDGYLVKFKDGYPMSGKVATFFAVPQTYHAG